MTVRDEAEDLKPCPFCGGPGSPTEYLKDGSESRWHRITCEACEVVGPEVEGHSLSFHGATGIYEAEAVTAWNTRAQAPQGVDRKAAADAIRQLLLDRKADKARIAELEAERDEAVKDRNAHADHVLRVGLEARDGFDALELLDRCWEAFGTAGNRAHLSLDEQITASLGEADCRAETAERALTELRERVLEVVEPFAKLAGTVPECWSDFQHLQVVDAEPENYDFQTCDFRAAASLAADLKGAGK